MLGYLAATGGITILNIAPQLDIAVQHPLLVFSPHSLHTRTCSFPARKLDLCCCVRGMKTDGQRALEGSTVGRNSEYGCLEEAANAHRVRLE